MAIIRGLFGSGNLESGIKKLDVRDMIFQLQPDAAPFFTVLQKVSKLRAVDTTIKWFEDDLLGNYTQVSGTQALGILDLLVDDVSFIQENDILKNIQSNECIRAIAVNDSTNRVTCVRGWGATAAAQMTDNDYLYKLGNAQMEGFTSPDSLVTAKVAKTNYLQLFSKTVTITETAEHIDVHGGNRRDFERNKKGVELKREIESQFLFGEPKEDTTGTQKRWQTGGVYYFVKGTGPELDMSTAALTESAWESFLKDLFLYGSSTKWFFCGPLILSQISQFATGKQRLEPGVTTTYGVEVNKYKSANGIVNLVRDGHFIGPFSGMGLALDMDELVYRYLQGQDLTLKLNVGNKKDHYYIDEYYGHIGLEIHHAKMHGIVLNVA